MAAPQSNGRAKKVSKPKASGYLNGSANGHLNGHADKSKSSSVAVRPRKQRRTFTGAVTSILLRLSVWYVILTAAFRCPSSVTQLNDSSPRVCTPYLQVRSYVTPHLDPYYQAYLAPHVEKAKPYVDRFERQVYTPAASFTKKQYTTYGAHRVEQARKQAEAGWDKTVRPHLQNAQNAAQAQYDVYLGHHVKRASDAASPYYDQIKTGSSSAYHKSLLPAYEASRPYLRKARVQGRHVIVDVVFPHVRSAKDITWAFLVRNIWPQLRVLYGDNVEPQLVRISERLGRYRDQQRVESVVDAVESETSTAATDATKIVPTVAASSSSSIASVASASISSASKAASSVVDSILGGDSSSAASGEAQSEASIDPKDSGLSPEELKEKLNEDLRKWQTKFAAAADKGAEDLEQRVAEITTRQVEKGVNGHGKALIVKLEESADSTIVSLKSFIKKTVKSIPEDATEKDLELAHEQCSTKARELGQTVKQKAQDVREWKSSYDTETDTLVQAAVKSTVEVLEKIHGLGLQEVGMRWAWTDGVTYKDWQNYHKLKSTLTEWQAEVESVGSRHEGLRLAHEEAKRLEDEAMSIASKNVNELVRLKDVAKWKLWADDATDDFTNNAVPPRARKAAQQVLDNVGSASSKVSEAIVGSETPVSESIASSIKSAAFDASSKMSEASSEVYKSVVGAETPSAQNVLSQASSKASEVVVDGASSVSSGASEAASSASSAASGAKDAVVEKASTATESPKKVWGGVAAQVLVEAREPVFDDVIDDDESVNYSVKLQSMVADAGDRASELSRAVSEALLGATKTQGSVESATSLASEQYAKAIAAASSALYGTQQQPLESATSIASVKFADAVTAASYAIYGTPTPTAVIKTVQVEVSSRYSNAVSLASEQLENAKSQLSVLASGTQQPAYQTLLSGFEKAYSDSVAAASSQLHAALQYTESAKSYAAGPTQGYFASVSSIASSRLSEGLSQASAQFSTQPTSGIDSARRQYYEAIGLAHGRYSEFLGAASSAVYGPQQGTAESFASVASASASSIASAASVSAASAASGVSDTVNSAAANAQSVASNAQAAAESLASQVSSGVIGSETPWTESVASQASENWEALIARASSQVYGQPTPWTESVYSQAGAYGAQATARVAEQYAGIQALISELVVGKEPDFTESVMNRFASAYSTGLPAVVASAESYVNGQYDSASSYAGESFEAATDYAADAYASASSVVSSIFTPPAAVETILSQASAQIDSALESASVAVYGTPKGAAEQASESVASAYASIQSQVSEAIYGTEQAQDSFTAAAVSAQAAISAAIFGTPTATGYAASITSGASDTYGSVASGAGEVYSSVASNAGEVLDSVASGAGEAYTSVASVASENADYAYSKISSAIYGPEQGAMESANSRIALAVEAANSRISEMYASASVNAGKAASSASSVATEATQRVKDEL
ncbi:uncharacterized protein EKO05_0000433 [Ascochyta rabiei]|uniref:Uncharacterized protein n=1 Tax=Didymella rabiei TaxID=5454 RepID=A0A163J6W1_DIDRA|nr:uncharacterized protein EKO05_0000433 [Ascochyta rabiei]KZM26183.1 hypothetical protein ST47_g2660 [Ascochyta rabiei]UPX09750.1 hypothetical protein EKO05_0000433 [Ascochyta rabiei]